MAEEQKASQDKKQAEATILKDFLNSDLNYRSKLGVPQEYVNSVEKKEYFKKLAKEDADFEEFIKLKYGSLENFYKFNPDLSEDRIYDPLTDYDVEVEIITEEQYLKSNFISSQELFMEVLGGVSTIQYLKVDGNAAQLIGTLKKSFIPSSQYETRDRAFAFFGSKKLLLWDITKQDWSSVYIRNMRRFIRDDTTGLQ